MDQRKGGGVAMMTLPGFEPDEPAEVRPRSAKDEDDALKIGWRRYNGAPWMCTRCVTNHRAGLQMSIEHAKYLRIGPEGVNTPFCLPHKQEQYEKDQLEGLVK